MKDKVFCWIRNHAKAIGGAVGGAVAWAAAQGLNVPDGVAAAVTVVVPAVIVAWAPRNKDCPA